MHTTRAEDSYRRQPLFIQQRCTESAATVLGPGCAVVSTADAIPASVVLSLTGQTIHRYVTTSLAIS